MRFIHTGDLHLDSPYRGLPPAAAAIRKEEQRLTFSNVIAEVNAFGADALLLSGDIFDGACVSVQTVAFLKDCFQRIRNTAVFVAPGNHDYVKADSIYKTVNLGDNVHIFGPEISAVEVAGIRIYGYGFGERFVSHSPLLDYTFKNDGMPSILLMHGDVGVRSDYNPIEKAALANSGVIYAALGHVHSFSGFQKAGNTTYAYCGIPEGRYFDETGTCGFVRGTIDKDGANLEFVPAAKRKNMVLSVDVSALRTHEMVIDKIKSSIASAQDLYKIVLTGQVEDDVYFSVPVLEKALSDISFFCKVIDNTKKGVNTEKSYLAKRFEEKLADLSPDIKDRALFYGLAALEGREIICE